MPWLNCKICNNKFYAKPRHIKLGWGKYCSKKCQYQSQYTGINIKCETCDKDIYRTKGELKKSKSKKYFCSKSCFCIWKNKTIFYGKNHANWKTGENAYRSVIIRAKIKPICKICGHKDKRVIEVHHIDKNRKNNSINNLVWLCRNCHFLVHNHKQEINN